MTQLNYDGSLKSLRETLCRAQSCVSRRTHDQTSIARDSDRLGRLIDEIDQLRPLGPDGKHGDRHTNTCGCEDTPRTQIPEESPTVVASIVRGGCIACKRGGLAVGEEGHIYCTHSDCPDPRAVDTLLRTGGWIAGPSTPEERHGYATNDESAPVPPNVIISELIEEIRLTVEYVGTEVLPPLPGWGWYDVLVKYAPEIARNFKEWEERMAPQREESRRIQREQNTYPRREGDMIILGPDTIMRLDRSAICYRGEEYYPAEPDPEYVRAWTQWLIDHGSGRIGVAETLVRARIEVPDA